MLEMRMYYFSVGRKLQLIDGFVVLSDAGKNVIISNQPYFYKKAELFPGSAFVIGADTAARLVNVRS